MTVSHPPYRRIAANLRDFAKVLEAMPDHERRKAAVGTCGCVGCRAGTLAARGFPPGSLGTGARASAPASSTERAAGLTGRTAREAIEQAVETSAPWAGQRFGAAS